MGKSVPKAILFDMDGLMVETEQFYLEAQNFLIEKYGGIKKEGVFAEMMGQKPIDSITLFAEECGIQKSPADLLAERTVIIEKNLREQLKAYEGLFTLLNHFEGRLLYAVGTGNTDYFMNLIVDLLGIRSRFGWLQSSDAVKKGKPDPEIYLRAAAGLGVRPDECVVLEDSANGCHAGLAAGAEVIAVPSDFTKDQNFPEVHSVVNSLTEAIPVIEKML